MKIHYSTIILFLATFEFFASDILIYVDQTRNLDYTHDGRLYKIKKDIKDVLKNYKISSKNQITLVELEKDNEKSFKGKVHIIGNHKKDRFIFSNRNVLREILKNHLNNEQTDFLLISHTVNIKRFNSLLSYGNRRYGVILASACRMASPEKLNLMKKYSNFAIASPVNIHLAHFEIDSIYTILLEKSPLKRAKQYLYSSFDRLKKFTKSNLVLNLYNLENSNSNFCLLESWDEIIVASKISLSKFERAQTEAKKFKIYGCEI